MSEQTCIANEELTSVITVRLTKTMHDALKSEAHRRETSLNKLCIATLKTALPEKTE